MLLRLSAVLPARRLTPKETERLQGFPDDYTAVAKDGRPSTDRNRYRALGNSMAVPCMFWLGYRIQQATR
jgi:DNA (cytosine-5)-methyltransferase 1